MNLCLIGCQAHYLQAALTVTQTQVAVVKDLEPDREQDQQARAIVTMARLWAVMVKPPIRLLLTIRV